MFLLSSSNQETADFQTSRYVISPAVALWPNNKLNMLPSLMFRINTTVREEAKIPGNRQAYDGNRCAWHDLESDNRYLKN